MTDSLTSKQQLTELHGSKYNVPAILRHLSAIVATTNNPDHRSVASLARELLVAFVAEIDRLNGLVADHEEARRVAAETKADPELTRLGLPQSWDRACAYALKVEPDGMSDTNRGAAGRYMDIRNAYIAGAESDDEFRQEPIELTGAEKTSADGS